MLVCEAMAKGRALWVFFAVATSSVLAAACAEDETAGGCLDCGGRLPAGANGVGAPSGGASDGGSSGDAFTTDALATLDGATASKDATASDVSVADTSTTDAKVVGDGSAKDATPPPVDASSSRDSGKVTYSTDFNGTENPISEGSAWTNGGAVGIDFQNVRTANSLAFGSGTSANYDDCIAHLSGYPANHFAEATVHVASGYSAQDSHEVELLVRFKITNKNARGYEINNGWNGAYSQIVRWNGAMGDFTMLSTTGPGFGALVEGDVIRAEAVGSTIIAYKNGNEVMRATDSTWSDGDPGMAFFIRPNAGSVPENYCFTSYRAGAL